MKTSCIKTVLSAIVLFIASAAAAQTWTQVPSPNPGTVRNILRGISGTSSTDIWAVGDYNINTSHLTQDTSKNLIMRWNGSNWQTFPGTEIFGTHHMLWDVKAIGASNVWAVGVQQSQNSSNPAYQLLHWNGTTWSHQTIGNAPTGSTLNALAVVSSNNIWAVGSRNPAPGGGPYLSFAAHFDGSSWSNIPVPAVGTSGNDFYSADGIAANDVWAVGGQSSGPVMANASDTGLAMHWNGNTWINMHAPALNQGPLYDVKMISSNDVWAVGYKFYLGGPYVVHWDGTTWTDVSAGIPPSIGELLIESATKLHGLGGEISYYNGTTWTVVNPLNQQPGPNLSGGVRLPNGEMWATGRNMDPQGNMQTLVYKMSGNTPAEINDGAAMGGVSVSVSPNPATKEVNLSWETTSQGDMEIAVTNAMGQAVFYQKISANSMLSLQLDVAQWAVGLYAVRLHNSDGTVVSKLIIRQ